MQKHFQFSVSLLLLVSYAAAVFFAKNLGFWTILLLLQPLLIWIVVSVLYQGIPQKILQASKSNTYRLDGSKSARRASREQKKFKQLRFALYVVSTAAMISVDWLIIFLNSKWIAAFWSGKSSLFIIFGCGVWLVFTLLFVQVAYLRILRDFYRGIQSRMNEYVDDDVGRLESHDDASIA